MLGDRQVLIFRKLDLRENWGTNNLWRSECVQTSDVIASKHPWETLLTLYACKFVLECRNVFFLIWLKEIFFLCEGLKWNCYLMNNMLFMFFLLRMLKLVYFIFSLNEAWIEENINKWLVLKIVLISTKKLFFPFFSSVKDHWEGCYIYLEIIFRV